MTSGKRMTEDEVRHLVEARGFTLVKYGNGLSNNSAFSCSKGHIWATKTINVTKGTSGCPECAREKKVKYSVGDINNIAKERGITLVSYSGNIKSNSVFKCLKNHEWETKAINVIRGSGCPHCARQARYKIEEIEKKLSPRNISVIRYAGNVKDLSLFKCKCGYEWETKASHVLRGTGCPKCAGRAPRSLSSIEDMLEARKIKIVKYSGDVSGRSLFECSEGHQWESITSNVIHMGTGCPKCAIGKTSSGEKALYDLVKSIAPDAKQSVRSVIPPQELDIVIPSRGVAIEFNGIWWHSEKYRDNKYHLVKRHETEKAGYRLISIREDLWNERRPQIENIIRNALGVNSEKVYARKCTIVSVDKESAETFLEQHHIQGFRNATHHCGLILGKQLVAVMSVTHWKKKDEWELTRYATSCNVPGGLSRLWKYLVNSYQISRGYSYVDRDLFTGTSYVHAGFVYDSTTVGFRIVNGSTTESRQKWNTAPEGMTQSEWYEKEGVTRLYDSGQDKLIFTR